MGWRRRRERRVDGEGQVDPPPHSSSRSESDQPRGARFASVSVCALRQGPEPEATTSSNDPVTTRNGYAGQTNRIRRSR